jgi:Sec-independent protein translocase protein TatA
MTDAKDKISEAARLAAESIEKFRKADERERESRTASTDDHLRVMGESIKEERQAIEEFGEAIELQRQAIEEHAADLEEKKL